ncbi:uncharacterized protein MELLADRAFT_79500 [Melampsora larici-populina 98AG31]|uniref:Exonuclease domain-containing protein n=1 Tax=Melampsora larici-populina (strain 98AG31 / pathotype 3-4-7) TaxID=747676 RepID=F4S7L8_MELLP|nr:uncharacterized protein MELLADRAFT_79500 [Melampsora larici-populina 98AG31]EGF99371.1 hypothetical protein MELLADRAFT_79500 [Melampsora larici-populina 98AG31]
MLPSLRLLHGIACPDHRPPHSSCLRQPCIFSHQHTHLQSIQTPITIPDETTITASPVPRLSKREGQLKSSLLKQRQVISRPVTQPQAQPRSQPQPPPQSLKSHPPSTTPADSSRSKSSSAAPNALTSLLPPDAPLTPPRIQINKSSSSHTAIAARQKLLDTLYAAFLSLYAALPQRVQLGAAHRDALKQEAECLKSTSRLTYRNAIINIVARLRKRKPAPEGKEGVLYFTGTLSEFDERQILFEKLKLGTQMAWLEPNRIEKYLLTNEKMIELDYVIELPDEDEDVEIDASGTEQTCERCNESFVVSRVRLPGDEEECSFHWGKQVFERIDAFMRLPPIGAQTTIPLVALDCELVYTTAGMSIARVTIIVPKTTSEGGIEFESLLDEFVRLPKSVKIIDLNTRFSGIQSEGELETAKFDLNELRVELVNLGVDSGTVICGHGLENDLKALRIVHHRCIDTVDLFPHPRGLPMRMSLKKLSSIFLNKTVQNSDPEIGHDSFEDASIALELIKYKIEHEL